MSHCVVLYYDYDEYSPPNCPGCGRFMGWDEETALHKCSCNGYLHHKTTGDPEVDQEYIEEGTKLPNAICKKPQGWKDEWGIWLIPEKIQLLGDTET